MICDRQKNSFKPFSSSQAKKILLHRYLDVEEQDWEITAFDQILTQKKVIWWCEIFFLFSSTYYQISNWMKIFKSKNHVKLKMKMLSFVDGKRIYIFIFHKEEEGNNGYSICFVDKNDVKSSVKLTQEKQDFWDTWCLLS